MVISRVHTSTKTQQSIFVILRILHKKTNARSVKESGEKQILHPSFA